MPEEKPKNGSDKENKPKETKEAKAPRTEKGSKEKGRGKGERLDIPIPPRKTERRERKPQQKETGLDYSFLGITTDHSLRLK